MASHELIDGWLDGAMLAALWLLAPPFVWPMALAVPASVVRMALTARAVPRLFASLTR